MKKLHQTTFALTALFTLALTTQAGPKPGDLDLSFDPGSSVNDAVRSVALQPDGKVVIGGRFFLVHGAQHKNLARLNADGSTDFTFMNGQSGPDGEVFQVLVQPDGKVIIIGQFDSVNGVARGSIARLNTDGSLDTGFQNGMSGVNWFGGAINCVTLQPNGQIVIGGAFSYVNDVVRQGIARLNANGTLDNGFQNGMSGISLEGSGPNGGYAAVSSVAVQPDGRIVIEGSFDAVNGVGRTNVARLLSNGALDNSFVPGPIIPGSFPPGPPILILTNRQIYAGGYLFNPNGSLDSTFQFAFGLGTSGAALQADGKILLGGGNIVRLNTNGTLDTNFSATVSYQVYSIVVQPDGKILMGGWFDTVDGVTRPDVARLNANGTLDTSFQNGTPGVGTDPLSLAVQSDGKVLLGGVYAVGGAATKGLARLKTDGSLDTSFQLSSNGISGGVVSSLLLQADGKVLVGGDFQTIAGLGRWGVARLNANGTLDTAFHNDSSYFVGVRSVALQADGKVLLGGSFSSPSVPRNGIARLNANGALDTTFQNGMLGIKDTNVFNPYYAVNAVAVQGDGKVVIGGYFQTVNGVGRTNIARLNSDGSIDTGFQNGMQGANGIIHSLAVQPDGKLLIGGEFGSVDGTPRQGIARLSMDGSLDSGFLDGMAGISSNSFDFQGQSQVTSLALQPDGKILIVGLFGSVNGISRTNIARLNSDGSLDRGFMEGMGGITSSYYIGQRGPDIVRSVALQSDGQVLIAGLFSSVNGVVRTYVARLLGADPLIVTTTNDSGFGSLRSALANADNGDSITFSLPAPSRITLTNGELLVSKSVNILGPGANNLAVDGNAHGRVFRIAPSNTVTISSLTVSNGLVTGAYPAIGGGILNSESTLTLSNCAVVANVAGNSAANGGWGAGVQNYAIHSNSIATLTITGSLLSGNRAVGGYGGAINNYAANGAGASLIVNSSLLYANHSDFQGGGILSEPYNGGNVSVQILNSAIVGNSVTNYGDGGGILSSSDASDGLGSGSLVILNSTISSNTAGFGGGIVVQLSGAAITNSTFTENSASQAGGAIEVLQGDTLQIVNSTFSGNSAGASYGGSILNVGAEMHILNSTFCRDSAPICAGIYNVGGIAIGSSILNEPNSQTISNIYGVSGSESLGYNLSSDNGGGLLNAIGDQINTDPLLGPLQDNGGPTFTHALLCGSPAIDKGKNFSGLATDQRGAARIFDDPFTDNAPGGDGTDIGAVEHQEICDRPPVADASATPTLVISGNGSTAKVTLDGSRCSDPDGNPLQYMWYEAGSPTPIASGVTADIILSVGAHSIVLAVNDGVLISTSPVTIEVITAADAIQALIAAVNAAGERVKPLDASLDVALKSLQKGHMDQAIHHLETFQHKVHVQIERSDPDLARELLAASQLIINALAQP